MQRAVEDLREESKENAKIMAPFTEPKLQEARCQVFSAIQDIQQKVVNQMDTMKQELLQEAIKNEERERNIKHIVEESILMKEKLDSIAKVVERHQSETGAEHIPSGPPNFVDKSHDQISRQVRIQELQIQKNEEEISRLNGVSSRVERLEESFLHILELPKILSALDNMRTDMGDLKAQMDTRDREAKQQALQNEKWQKRIETEMKHQSHSILLKIDELQDNKRHFEGLEKTMHVVERETTNMKKQFKTCESQMKQLQSKVVHYEEMESEQSNKMKEHKSAMRQLDEQLHSNMKQLEKVIYDLDSRLQNLEVPKAPQTPPKRAEQVQKVGGTQRQCVNKRSPRIDQRSLVESEQSGEAGYETEENKLINDVKDSPTNSAKRNKPGKSVGPSFRYIKLLQASPSTPKRSMASVKYFRNTNQLNSEAVANNSNSSLWTSGKQGSRSEADTIVDISNMPSRMVDSSNNDQTDTPYFPPSQRSLSYMDLPRFTDSGRNRPYDSNLQSGRSGQRSPPLLLNRRTVNEIQRYTNNPSSRRNVQYTERWPGFAEFDSPTVFGQDSFRQSRRAQARSTKRDNSLTTLHRYEQTDISASPKQESDIQKSSIAASVAETTRNSHRLSLPTSQIRRVSEVAPDWTSDSIDQEENLINYEPLQEPPVEEDP